MKVSGKNPTKPDLILASASPYRRQLLERLTHDFTVCPGHIDETRLADEPAEALVTRLAEEKARAAANQLPSDKRPAIVIGSDQIAVHENRILGKPGNAKNAAMQLESFSGSMVRFLTAVCVLDTARDTRLEHTDETRVFFRDLDNTEIESYVNREQPFDCAGGFKAESLGIVLFEKIESEDPTGLLGLPLIWVTQAIRVCGIDLLDN